MQNIYDLIIVGGGPAGYTCALYAAREALSVLLIEKAGSGGQMLHTDRIDNYPGVPHTDGQNLGEAMRDQAHSFGAETMMGKVVELKLEGDVKEVILDDGTELKAKTITLCMGSSHRKLGAEGEDELRSHGVSYCAVCDGMFFRDKEVAVIGGGNNAVEQAIFLSRVCSKVYLIHRRDEFRAERFLVNLLPEHDNIVPLMNKRIKSINGEVFEKDNPLDSLSTFNHIAAMLKGPDEGKVKDKRVKSVTFDDNTELDISAVFVAIGSVPNTQLVSDVLELDKGGYIITDEDMRTNIKGVFAAGDIRKKTLRQAITAASDGAIAANSAEHFIDEHY